jgi:hypothetical protein
MTLSSFGELLLDNRMARRCVDTGFGWYAHRRVRYLDRASAADAQQETLLQLIRFAQETHFGRQYDFARIRSVADYQRRVPLCDYETFWNSYWRPAYPDVHDITWPGSIPYFALSSGTTSGTTKHLPVSTAMLASNRRAALTSLAWFRAAHPKVPLFSGRLFFLGGSTDLRPAGRSRERGVRNQALEGDLSGIVTREASARLRPFVFPPQELALLSDWEQKLTLLAEQSVKLSITMVSGVPSWLLALFDRIKQITGKRHIADIWPHLRLVIHGGTSFDPYRSLFRQVIGSDTVHFLETYPASEGFIAAEDPRHEMLRLIPDHDLFFEFVPVDELGSIRPTRHTLAEIIPGVHYAVVLTTCAGLWSYQLGDTVCFESRDPPLLRFTGRTSQFLSAFGEHLIGEEVEGALSQAAVATGAAIADFHVGPVFPASTGGTGHHRYLVEFVQPPHDARAFLRRIDESLCRINEDYRAHRGGDLTIRPPQMTTVPRGGFAAWMKSKGKLGGQHKVPRLDNTGRLTSEIARWLVTHSVRRHPRNGETSRVRPATLVSVNRSTGETFRDLP